MGRWKWVIRKVIVDRGMEEGLFDTMEGGIVGLESVKPRYSVATRGHVSEDIMGMLLTVRITLRHP